MRRLCRRTWLALALACVAPVVAVAADLRADLAAGVKDGFLAVDPAADGGRCVAADAGRAGGTVFAAQTPALEPGVYEARVRLKLSRTNHMNTAALTWTVNVGEAGAGSRAFDILVIEQAGVYQEIPCRFVVARGGKARVTLAWQRVSIRLDGKGVELRVDQDEMPGTPEAAGLGEKKEAAASDLDLETELAAEPPLAGLKHLYMAVDRVLIVPVTDLDVTRLEVDKIRYRPGERATVAVALRNYAAAERTATVETVLVHDLDTELPVDRREVKLGAGAEASFTAQGPVLAEKWGYAVRCRVSEGGQPRAEREEYFTVHENLWAVMMPGRGPAQFTAHVTPENAVAAAQANKRRYRNWCESGFWAPDEFGDFTPDSEYWWGGQGCYYGSVTGTKLQIAEGHKLGIAFAVYANIWGGDGPPAFELLRARPDWGHVSSFDVEWFERWDRNTMGKGEGKRGMHVWPSTVVNYTKPEVFEHHGRELIGTHRMFGWDAVRYDSHDINPDNARVVDIVKRVVRAEVPEFQFGYNSSVPMGVAAKIEPFKAQCEGEGLIMEEGIRQFGGAGGLSFSGGRTYADFAKRILDFKAETRRHGGHFTAIGMDDCYPNDLLYQYIFWFAANTHMCYDWKDVSVADYAQFATRLAGLFWDLRVTDLPQPLDTVDLGPARDWLWLPERYMHQRDLGAGRRQLILHLINAPTETNLGVHDDAKLPPPRAPFRIGVKLPSGAKLRGAWCFTAEPRLTQTRLQPAVADGRATVEVPRLRFWNVVVLDLENVPAPEVAP